MGPVCLAYVFFFYGLSHLGISCSSPQTTNVQGVQLCLYPVYCHHGSSEHMFECALVLHTGHSTVSFTPCTAITVLLNTCLNAHLFSMRPGQLATSEHVFGVTPAPVKRNSLK